MSVNRGKKYAISDKMTFSARRSASLFLLDKNTLPYVNGPNRNNTSPTIPILFSKISLAASRKSGIDPMSEMTMPMLMNIFSKELEGSTERMFPGTVPSTYYSILESTLSLANNMTSNTPITM